MDKRGSCPAPKHDTTGAYRRGCRCPQAVELMRRRWRTAYLPGRRPVGKYRPKDIDEIAVDRACYGDPVRLSVPERRIVSARLTRLGYTARQIGERLGVSWRTVQRYREQTRRAA